MSPLLRLIPVLLCVSAAVRAGAFSEERDDGISTFDSGGMKIAYRDQGHGVPVVLLQGFGGSLSHWPKMRNALLDAGYRVIAMDARGHGQSDKPHDVESYGHHMADDVVRLLDHVQVRRAHVVGYSMGGDIANKVRERHPLRLNTVTVGGVGRGVFRGWTTSEFDYTKISDSLERGEGLKVLFREPNGAGRRKLSESDIEKMNSSFMEGQDQFALAAVIRAYPDLEVSEESLKSNAVPTLVVVGQYDPEKPTADELMNVMKNVSVVVIPDVDHFNAGGTTEFIRAVIHFLKSHRGKS